MKEQLIQLYIVLDIANEVKQHADKLTKEQKKNILTGKTYIEKFVQSVIKEMKKAEIMELIKTAKSYKWALREDIHDISEYALEGCKECDRNKKHCGKRKMLQRLDVPGNGEISGCEYEY